MTLLPGGGLRRAGGQDGVPYLAPPRPRRQEKLRAYLPQVDFGRTAPVLGVNRALRQRGARGVG